MNLSYLKLKLFLLKDTNENYGCNLSSHSSNSSSKFAIDEIKTESESSANQSKISRENLDSNNLDWWSKYEASIDKKPSNKIPKKVNSQNKSKPNALTKIKRQINKEKTIEIVNVNDDILDEQVEKIRVC